MKLRNIALMVVLMLGVMMIFGSVAEAQNFQVVNNVFTQKQLKNSGVDSVVALPIVYNGIILPALTGCYPDSIRIEHFCSGDSVYAIDLYLKVKWAENSSYNRIQLDSMKSTTAVLTVGGITLTNRDYSGANTIGIAVTARASGNAAVTATASKFTIKETRFFRK